MRHTIFWPASSKALRLTRPSAFDHVLSRRSLSTHGTLLGLLGQTAAMTASIWTAFAAATLLLGPAAAQVDPTCRHPLGMQDMRIPDSALSATSHHAATTGARYARLERHDGDGAWCPLGTLEPNTDKEYLQIKLTKPHFITNIATQGRYAAGIGAEYVTSYKVNYTRDMLSWKQWASFQGTNIMSGNSDTFSSVRHLLSPALVGVVAVRVIPITRRRKSVCMRLELYGCTWSSALVAYDIPTPDDFPAAGSLRSSLSAGARPPISTTTTMFSDDTYDGMRSGRLFSDGLGQLTDGVVGNDDVTQTVSRYQTKARGYDYVGWSSPSGSRDVTMTFKFADVRNLTTMRVHCSNDHSLGASIFAAISFELGFDGAEFIRTPLAFRVPEPAVGADVLSQFVSVPLANTVARYLRATFRTRGRRLLVSEIEFYGAGASHAASSSGGNAWKTPVPGNSPSPDVHAVAITDESLSGADYPDDRAATVGKMSKSGGSAAGLPPTTAGAASNVGVIVGSLVAVIVLLVLIVLGLCYRQHRMRKTLTPPRYPYASSSSNRGEAMVTLTPLMTTHDGNDQQAGPLSPKTIPIPIYQEIGPSATTVLPSDDNHLYLEPVDVIRPTPPPPYQRHQPDETHLSEQSSTNSAADSGSSSFGNSTTRRLQQPDLIQHHVEASMTSHYAEADVFVPSADHQPIQGVSGNHMYAIPWEKPSPRRHRPHRAVDSQPGASTSYEMADDNDAESWEVWTRHGGCDVPEFPRDRLQLNEKIGEGQFGEVRLCTADPTLRSITAAPDFRLSGPHDAPVQVALKVLRTDASSVAKDQFLKEVKVMSRLRHPNIVRLLAVCTTGEPLAMVTEYMENGDLNQYLRSFDDFSSGATPDSRACSDPGKTISNEVLVKMATQIASGMAYLASINFVHRDLATRNCLVGAEYSIRICDFGMSRNMYQSDYYRMQGRAILPIRWMSWECVLMGKFSSASDVWSFAVTLWEMFSLCKHQPFAAFDDRQVIENMHHVFRKTGNETSLPRPKRCPANLFNMMRQCWKRAAEDRPTFAQLRSYLAERAPTSVGASHATSKRPQAKAPVAKPRSVVVA